MQRWRCRCLMWLRDRQVNWQVLLTCAAEKRARPPGREPQGCFLAWAGARSGSLQVKPHRTDFDAALGRRKLADAQLGELTALITDTDPRDCGFAVALWTREVVRPLIA